MKTRLLMLMALALITLGTGCRLPIPPGAEVGPERTIAYDVLVETTPPGAAIEAIGEPMGKSPIHLKVFGNIEGTFHNFGSNSFVARAVPMSTNQFEQTRIFRTGIDPIPKTIHFDLNHPSPPNPPPSRGYHGPYFYFYGAPYYPYYYGPRAYFPLPPLPPLPFPHH
jgi:hypothetical protein